MARPQGRWSFVRSECQQRLCRNEISHSAPILVRTNVRGKPVHHSFWARNCERITRALIRQCEFDHFRMYREVTRVCGIHLTPAGHHDLAKSFYFEHPYACLRDSCQLFQCSLANVRDSPRILATCPYFECGSPRDMIPELKGRCRVPGTFCGDHKMLVINRQS